MRRHDADHGVVRAIESNLLAENIRIRCEAPVPEFRAEHNDGRTAWAVFLLRKTAAENRRDVRHGDAVGGDVRAEDPFRVVAAGEIEAVAVNGSHGFENIAEGFCFEDFGSRKIVDEKFLLRRIGVHNFPARDYWVSDAVKEAGVNQAVDGCSRSDSDCENQDYHERQNGSLRDDAQTVAKILDKVLDEAHAARVPALLFHLLDTAQVSPGGSASLFRIGSSGDAFGNLLFQVEAQFFIKLL